MRILVDALRSGNFTQGAGALRTWIDEADRKIEGRKFNHCCLDVATQCDVDAGLPEEYQYDEDMDNVWDPETLSGPVMEWLDIDEPDPILDFGGGNKMRASFANDEANRSFNIIACAFAHTYAIYEYEDEAAEVA